MSSRKRPCRVELTSRAVSDLRQIEEYSIAEWGRKTADGYLDAVAAALDRLRENPEILRAEPDFAEGLFFYRVRKHFLVCDRHEDLIIVLAVIYTSMDIPSRLAELEPRLHLEAQWLREKLHGNGGARRPKKDR
jgi:toxin ParE1/3/4